MRALLLQYSTIPHFCRKVEDITLFYLEGHFLPWTGFHQEVQDSFLIWPGMSRNLANRRILPIGQDLGMASYSASLSKSSIPLRVSEAAKIAQLYESLHTFSKSLIALNPPPQLTVYISSGYELLMHTCRNSMDSKPDCVLASEFLLHLGERLGCLSQCSSITVTASLSSLFFKLYHQGGGLSTPSTFSSLVSSLPIILKANFACFMHFDSL